MAAPEVSAFLSHLAVEQQVAASTQRQALSAEVRAVLAHIDGQHWLMASLLYGAGLRLMECVRLRVKDIDYEYRQIVVREGKGQKDRVTMLPQSLTEPLKRHLEKVTILHQQDLKEGFGKVYLPFALERKYTGASREWG